MMDLHWLMLIFALIDFIKFNVITAEEILGCGGFVKSEVPIDFSQIEVSSFHCLNRLIGQQGNYPQKIMF